MTSMGHHVIKEGSSKSQHKVLFILELLVTQSRNWPYIVMTDSSGMHATNCARYLIGSNVSGVFKKLISLKKHPYRNTLSVLSQRTLFPEQLSKKFDK